MPYPVVAGLTGNILVILAFTFLAPLPFIPITPSLGLVMAAMAINGTGMGFTLVSAFTRAQSAVLRLGYRDDLNTFIFISGNN